MDRTHILNNGVIHANKKLNGLQKCSETFLCDEIHDNLRALALVIPLSDEFKEIFERVSKHFFVLFLVITICDISMLFNKCSIVHYYYR